MSKIYSRKRFILIKRKSLQIVLVMLIASSVYVAFLKRIAPVFETLCEEKVRSVATVISNQESTKAMNKYQYDELYTVEKDEEGNITIIRANVVPINNMISDLTEGIQNRFDELKNTQIGIPIGNLFGKYYFSGLGPSIPTKVIMTGTLDTELKSEFTDQGINQTLHRLYVNFECYVQIITPVKNFKKKITNQVLIAEHVIIGNIPNTYYNLDGMNSVDDVLNVIE